MLLKSGGLNGVMGSWGGLPTLKNIYKIYVIGSLLYTSENSHAHTLVTPKSKIKQESLYIMRRYFVY